MNTDHTFYYQEKDPIIAFDLNKEGVDLKINTDDTLLLICITKESFNKLAIAAYEALETGKDTCFYGNKFYVGSGKERKVKSVHLTHKSCAKKKKKTVEARIIERVMERLEQRREGHDVIERI